MDNSIGFTPDEACQLPERFQSGKAMVARMPICCKFRIQRNYHLLSATHLPVKLHYAGRWSSIDRSAA